MQTDMYSEAEECKQTEAGMVWWFTVYLAGMVAREREKEAEIYIYWFSLFSGGAEISLCARWEGGWGGEGLNSTILVISLGFPLSLFLNTFLYHF